MGSIDDHSFSAPPELVSAHGLLFDFDGTIIDSTPAIVKHWHKQGRLMGVDPDVILATSHGRRSIDVFKIYDPSKANWDYICHEESLIPKEFGHDAVEIPGARKLLASLEDVNAPWAVVTSGTKGLVNGWLEVLNLAHPRQMVVAEDVENGKPDPTCYLLGRRRLDLPETARMIVLEDAPAGVQAGKAAGFRVIGLATTHTVEQVKSAGADWIVRDLSSVKLKAFQGGEVQVVINDALVN
ncbi:DL-glycerol-3-phosphatase [Cladophialophora chaetospira]|uniref:DL-glycerol-3-phosphatase n=1 Tax=Cladophialophora chaetospira TaxID=386627 RepID=A0AA38XNJ3_9EURO|nr:DL-glycerol-3-phosphatase [Cladophialophora chaetospira]